MRTRQEIEAEVDVVQQSYTDLRKLTSSSQVSFFRLLKNMFITLVMAVEQRTDAAIADITKVIDETRIGSIAWYVELLKKFQYGDAVSLYDGARIGYAVDNPDKRIVIQAAVVEGGDGRLLAKVAKVNPGQWPFQALDPNELAALQEYVRQVKYAGVAIDVISLQPDEVKIEATCKYDRQVLSSEGKMLSNPVRIPINEAIFGYARSLPFDSNFSWTALTDQVQLKEGVKDFVIQRSYIRAAGTTTWTEFSRETASRAGHVKVLAADIIYV